MLFLLYSFPWFCGAYGVTGPNKNIPHLHLFITFERGTEITDVRLELQEKFGTDAMEYFELLRQPERTPEFKYLADSNDRSSASSSASSVLPTPGGGVLACDNKNYTGLNHMNHEKKDDLQLLGTGTLTMFCFKDEQHYALTCFHLGSVNDEDNLSTPKESDKKHSSRLSALVKSYWFAENNMENNNEAIPDTFNKENSVPLGDFHMHHLDKQCDILSLKIPSDRRVDCKMPDVTCPDWNSFWEELLEDTASNRKKTVEKDGFKSGETYGHITLFSASYKDKFKNAIAVEGCNKHPFLENGDSGALVYIRDRSNIKTVFAYGVCEVDELPMPGPGDDDEDEDDLGYVYPGPFSICLRLNTALENLNLKEGACVNDCGEGC